MKKELFILFVCFFCPQICLAASPQPALSRSSFQDESKKKKDTKVLCFLKKIAQSVERSRAIGAILALTVGVLGIHAFYFGKNKQGLTMLLSTLIALGLIVLGLYLGFQAFFYMILVGVSILAGMAIWAVVDFIRILAGRYPEQKSRFPGRTRIF